MQAKSVTIVFVLFGNLTKRCHILHHNRNCQAVMDTSKFRTSHFCIHTIETHSWKCPRRYVHWRSLLVDEDRLFHLQPMAIQLSCSNKALMVTIISRLWASLRRHVTSFSMNILSFTTQLVFPLSVLPSVCLSCSARQFVCR